MKNIELKIGDCLKLFEEVEALSVDAVVCDPPYNISKKNNFKTMGRAGIDFGEWDKGADLFSYIKSCFRVLKRGGSFIVFNDWKNLGDIVRFAEAQGFVTKDMLRLEKTNPMPRNRDRRYITDFECAIWFTKPGAKWTFNRQDEKYQRPKFVKSVEKGLHPTQKNLSLMEDLILIHTNKNDLVLDPFMGSGTTGLACKRLERRFLGFEIDEKFFSTASERIESEIK